MPESAPIYDPEKNDEPITRPNLKSIEGGRETSAPDTSWYHPDEQPEAIGDREKEAGDGNAGRHLSVLPGGKHDHQVGKGHTGAGEASRWTSVRSALKSRKNKLIAGLALLAATIAASIVIFLALLPLKIAHIVTNLEHRFFATSENAVQNEEDKMLNTYLQKYALTKLTPDRCKGILSTTNRACKAVVTGKGLISNMFRGWADANLEADLAEKFGLEFARKGGAHGPIYLKAPSLGTPADGIDASAFADGKVASIWDLDGFQKVSRQEVRAAVRDAFKNESFWKRMMYRYKVGRLLEVKYGIKRCIIFCDTRDRFADWQDAKHRDLRKSAYKIIFNQRVLGQTGALYGQAFDCILDGCDPTAPDEADSVDTHKNGLDGCEANCQVNGEPLSKSDIAIYGNGIETSPLSEVSVLETAKQDFGDSSKAIAASRRIEKDGFLAVLRQDLSDHIKKKLEGKGAETGAGSIDFLKQFLGIIGLLYTINSFLQFTQHGASVLQKFAYDINAAQAVQLFSIYRTYADEAKSGHVDPTMVGSFTHALDAGTHCDPRPDVVCEKQVGGTAGIEGTPAYNAVFGTPTTQSASAPLANLFSSRTYAASSTAFPYDCKNNNPVPAGSANCPDINLIQTDTIVNILKDLKSAFQFIYDAIGPFIQTVLDAIKAILNFVCSTGICNLAVIFQWLIDLLQKLFPWLFTFIEDVFKMMIQPMLMMFGEMSGGRTGEIMMLGADKAGSDYSHNALGGVLLSNDQIKAVLNDQQWNDNYAYNHQSFFARMFDTNSNQAPLVKLAMAMPDSQTSAISKIASFFSNPIARLSSMFGSIFHPAYAIAPDALTCSGGLKGDCFGVTQYGYPEDDPIFSQDPEQYWNTHCSNTPGYQDPAITTDLTKAYNLWSYANNGTTTNINPYTYVPENPQGPILDANGNPVPGTDPKGTNPCALLMNAAASGGGLFTNSVFSPEDNPTGTTGGTTGSSATCDSRTNTISSQQTGYQGGNPVQITLCALPNLTSSSEESTPGSQYYVDGANGKALVNASYSTNFYNLVDAAKKAGVNLSAISTFRTMAHQQALCAADSGCSHGDYTHVAQPGYSNHQMGLAIDFGGLPSSPGPVPGNAIWNWLSANAGTYGVKNYAAEAWHWSSTGN